MRVQAADRGWLQRDDPRVRTRDEAFEVLPGVTPHRVLADARTWIARSAESSIGWVRGDLDHRKEP